MESKRPLADWVRASFDQEREIPFDEAAWLSLSEKLDRSGRRRKGWLFLPWLISIGCASAALCFYLELRSSSHPGAGDAERALTSTTGTDTVYIERVRIQTDTLYLLQKIYSAAAGMPVPYRETTLPGSASGLSPRPVSGQTADSLPSGEVLNLGPVKPADSSEQTSFPVCHRLPGRLTDLRMAPYLNTRLVRVNLPGIPAEKKAERSSWRPGLETTILRIEKGQPFQHTVSAFEGSRTGIQTLATITWQGVKGIRIHGGIGRRYAWQRSTTHFPTRETFELDAPYTQWREWESTARQWLYEVGIGFTPRPHSRLQPFADFSLNAGSGFTRRMNGEQTSDEPYGPLPYWTRMETHDPGFQFTGWRAGLGVDYFRNTGWSIGLSGHYYGTAGSTTGLAPDWGAGIRLGWLF